MLTYCNRGLLYVQRNEPDKAIADYNRALQLKPDLVAAYDGRGNAYAKKKDFPHAIEDFNHAAELDPGQSRTYYSRAGTYKEMHDWQHARERLPAVHLLGAGGNRGLPSHGLHAGRHEQPGGSL